MSVNNVNTQNYDKLFSQVDKQAKAKKISISLFDTNKDGKFSIDELQKALNQLNSNQPIPQKQEEKGFWSSIGEFFSGIFGEEEQTQSTKSAVSNVPQPQEENTKNLTKVVEKDKDDWVTEIYKNSKGQVVEKKCYDENGSLQWQSKYNDKGQCAEKIYYDSNGKIYGKRKYEYNEKGQEIKSVFHDEKGDKVNFSERKYNDDGSFSESTYDANGKLEDVVNFNKNHKPTDSVFYDENGKEIEKTYYKNGKMTKTIVNNKNGRFDIDYDEEVLVKKVTHQVNGKEIRVYEGNLAKLIAENPENLTEDLLGNGKLSTNSIQQIGNCWLHGHINAIMQNEKGKEYLNKLISKDPKTGDITVFLPGAKEKDLPQPKGDGIYKYSENDLLKRINNTTAGDGDYTALVCAVEDYIKQTSGNPDANTNGGHNDDYSLLDIEKIIFGNSFNFESEKVNFDELKKKFNSKEIVIGAWTPKAKEGLIKGEIDGEEIDLLDFHSFTVVEINDDNVVLMESNYPDKKIKISKEAFSKMEVNTFNINELADIDKIKATSYKNTSETIKTDNGTTTTQKLSNGTTIVEEKDANNNLIKRTETTPDGTESICEYENNKLTKKTINYEDGALKTITYNIQEGTRTESITTNQNGEQKETISKYNANNDMIGNIIVKITLKNGEQSVSEYTEDNNIIKTIETEKDGTQRIYEYDANECMVKGTTTYPDGAKLTWENSYDSNNNITKKKEIYETDTYTSIKEYDKDGKEIKSIYLKKKNTHQRTLVKKNTI